MFRKLKYETHKTKLTHPLSINGLDYRHKGSAWNNLARDTAAPQVLSGCVLNNRHAYILPSEGFGALPVPHKQQSAAKADPRTLKLVADSGRYRRYLPQPTSMLQTTRNVAHSRRFRGTADGYPSSCPRIESPCRPRATHSQAQTGARKKYTCHTYDKPSKSCGSVDI